MKKGLKKIKTVSKTGGIRYNKGKCRISLCPRGIKEAVANVLWYSAEENGGKYPMGNWKKGMPWQETIDSTMRHLEDFNEGHDFDKESGLNTLHHVATNVAFLIDYYENHPELDNRIYKKKKK